MWDFIIVGAGSAGCAVAYQIARNAPDKTILVLEAGGSDRTPLVKIPAGQVKAIPTFDWGYTNEPDDTRHGKVDHWWRGRVVGGSSSVNGTMYVRGAARDYDRWNHGFPQWNGPGWSAEEIMPLFEEIELSDQPDAIRGHDGPLHVRTVAHAHPLSRAFVDAAVTAGHTRNSDYNGSDQSGVSFAQLTQKGRFRWSSADAFLRPALKSPNVKLVTGAEVSEIETEGGIATGIAYVRGGQRIVERGRQIILSGGAINTPKLLMLSGIGDPEELGTHGIEVRHALPGVGRNLREHPLLAFGYRTRIPSFNPTGGIRQAAGFLTQYLRGKEGPISNPFEATAFLKSRADRPTTDMQIHFSPVGYYVGERGNYVLHSFPSAMVLLDLSYPQSTGRIRLGDAHPNTLPKIEYRMFEDERDLEALVDGVERIREIMRAEPMNSLVEEVLFPADNLQSREEIAAFVRQSASIAYHPVGTCRMGLDDMAVVTPDLRVRGFDNLWIADASIMPDLVSGNTNAACIMIGAKLGKQICGS